MCKLELLDPKREGVVLEAPKKIIKPIRIHDIANIVPMALEAEQEALKKDIKKNGYKKELGLILLWKGEIVDGRCRQKALLELGINPRMVSKDLGNLTYAKVVSLVKSSNTRRNLTVTQKAISAYTQTNLATWGTRPPKVNQLSQRVASKVWGVDKKMITYVSSIVKSVETIVTEMKNKSIPPNTILYAKIKGSEKAYEKTISYDEILENLFDGHQVKIGADSSYTESVKAMAKLLKVIAESLVMEVLEVEEIEWNPDGQIKTERGKEHYYKIVDAEAGVSMRMSLVELINTVYSLPDTVNVSIPTELENVVRNTLTSMPKRGSVISDKWVSKTQARWMGISNS